MFCSVSPIVRSPPNAETETTWAREPVTMRTIEIWFRTRNVPNFGRYIVFVQQLNRFWLKMSNRRQEKSVNTHLSEFGTLSGTFVGRKWIVLDGIKDIYEAQRMGNKNSRKKPEVERVPLRYVVLSEKIRHFEGFKNETSLVLLHTWYLQ